jgi:transcriptional regulator with XRE-family HTH domain
MSDDVPTKVKNILLYNARKDENLTRAELANLINVSERSILRWEQRTQNPYPENIRELCKVFRKQPKDLGLDFGSGNDKVSYLTGEMASKRITHSATLLQDGSVLVAAGRNSPSTLTHLTERYIPLEGIWSTTAGKLQTARNTYNNSLVTLPNGKALLVGGADHSLRIDYSSTELYDPSSGSWSLSGDLQTPRRYATLTLLEGGKVLIAAGAHGQPDANRFLKSSEIFDSAIGLWKSTGELNIPRDGAMSILLSDGRVLVAGGEIPWMKFTDRAELFDPVNETWSLTESMPWEWTAGAMVALPDGRALVTGGINRHTVFSDAVIFDPNTNQWKKVSPMKEARSGHTMTLLQGNCVLVIGGGNADNVLQTTEIYNITNDTWTLYQNLHIPRSSHRAIKLLSGDILIIGGTRGNPEIEGNILSSCEILKM